MFLKLTDNLFVGNKGKGLELLHIENIKSEHVGQKIYMSDEKTFMADFNGTIGYQGLEDFEDFVGQASKLDIVDDKVSLFDQIMSPLFDIEHIFTDVLPLFVKFLILILILLAVIIPVYC